MLAGLPSESLLLLIKSNHHFESQNTFDNWSQGTVSTQMLCTVATKSQDNDLFSGYARQALSTQRGEGADLIVFSLWTKRFLCRWVWCLGSWDTLGSNWSKSTNPSSGRMVSTQIRDTLSMHDVTSMLATAPLEERESNNTTTQLKSRQLRHTHSLLHAQTWLAFENNEVSTSKPHNKDSFYVQLSYIYIYCVQLSYIYIYTIYENMWAYLLIHHSCNLFRFTNQWRILLIMTWLALPPSGCDRQLLLDSPSATQFSSSCYCYIFTDMPHTGVLVSAQVCLTCLAMIAGL